LKPFKIFPRSVRLDNGSIPKGYKLDQFKDAIARYVEDEKSTNADVTPIQTATPPQINNNNGLGRNQTATAKNDVAVSKACNPLKSNECGGVAVCQGAEADIAALGRDFGKDGRVR
jgi:hypothetical protein